MIVYRILRALGRLALRWFYRDVEVVGIDHLPQAGPVLLASNHPNALVDALVIACTLNRPVTLTAKATLLDHPATRALMRAVGVVPLRRASDERARRAHDPERRTLSPDPSRNEQAFGAVLDALRAGGMVLLFPEGKSHSEPALAPLKTGLARLALMARDDRHLDHLPIVPVGLTFERKWEPRSRVLIRVGTPILTGVEVPNDAAGVAALTDRIDAGLRQVTLNFSTEDDARRVLAISGALAEVLDGFRPLHSPDPPFAEHVRLAQRVDVIASHLPRADRSLVERVDRFLERLTAFEHRARENAVAASDVQMPVGIAPGIWFVARELVIAVVAGPLALWGRVNHWAPLRLARLVALRTSETPDEPAMRTIVAGLVLVLASYAVQTTAVVLAAGWLAGLGYAISLPVSASWDFSYGDRRRRAVARVRTYLRLRRDSALREMFVREGAWLRAEAFALNDVIERELAGAASQPLAV
jgi:glycerol-3-phosphate O-acyltransferase / dihydroxyacetone phosphate acyltransferase